LVSNAPNPTSPQRYTKKELRNMHENGALYKAVETGTKKQMYNKQNQVLKRYKDKYGKYPPLNKNGK
jgi:DnaJ-domain-containing protein 1